MIILLRKVIFFLLVIILLFTSGCWNRREMDTLTINSALGFDLIETNGETKILLSVLTIKPSQAINGAGGMTGGGAGQQQPATTGQVISITGDTIQDAVRDWNQCSSRQLFMAHTVLFVIGESVAREGIGWVIDFGTRNRDIPERAMVVVCEGMARDALQAQPEFEPLLSTEVYNILNQNRYFVSKSKATDIMQTMYDLLTPGRDASLAFLKTFTPPEKGSAIRQTPQTMEGKDREGEQPDHKVPTVAGAVIFRGEKAAGRLNEAETQGMLFIMGEAQGGIIPVAFDSTRKNTSFLFRDVNTKVKPVIEKNEITFQVEIKGTGELIGAAPGTIDITNRHDIQKMEYMINKEVEHRCRRAVNKAQELGADPFGFGDKLHRTHPGVWKEIEDRWEDIFPHIRVSITAEFSVEHSGLIDKSLHIR